MSSWPLYASMLPGALTWTTGAGGSGAPARLPPWTSLNHRVPGGVDQASYPQASLPVSPYPDQRPLLVGSYWEPPEFPRIEGKRAGKREPLQALRRPPLGGEERRLGEDGAGGDRALLLAQHAR